MEFEGAQSMTPETVQAMNVETQPQPVTAVEALIHINNQLNQHEVHPSHIYELGQFPDLHVLWEQNYNFCGKRDVRCHAN